MADPTNPNTPQDSDFAKGAAAELRALKQYLADQLESIAEAQADIVEQLANINAMNPIGMISPWPTLEIPNRYLICDGTAYDPEDYPELFAVYQYQYGQAGDFFRVPDLRACTIRGLDSFRGIDVDRIFGSFQASAVGRHRHFIAANVSPNNESSSNVTAISTVKSRNPSNFDIAYALRHDSDEPKAEADVGNSSLGHQNANNDIANPAAPLGTDTRMANVAMFWLCRYR